jgi:hypothetical protein
MDSREQVLRLKLGTIPVEIFANESHMKSGKRHPEKHPYHIGHDEKDAEQHYNDEGKQCHP